jgi:vacuolar-type H+-ATPase subunit E/Vma4
MTALSRRAETALAPVRGSLMRAARQEAAGIRRDAAEHVTALMDTARREAERIRFAAVEEGTVTARSEAVLRSARVRRQAQETVLGRRSALRLELHRQVRASAVELRTDPHYPALRARLIEQGHALLGWEAMVAESPEGGVIAEAGSRRLDLSLPALATRALESMTQEVRALWTG